MNQLRQWRQSRHLSQAQLGLLLGVQPATVGTWERGEAVPRQRMRRKLARVLRALQCDSVALVGHQPDLGDFAAWLVGSRKAQIDFAKGGVAHLVCHDNPGKGAGKSMAKSTAKRVAPRPAAAPATYQPSARELMEDSDHGGGY